MRWTRASLVVLALLALIFAPGTRFAAATEPDSDLVPVRGFRRLTQTTNDGGVEYLQRAKLTANDFAEKDYFGTSVSIDGDTMVIGAYGDDDDGSASGSAYVFTRNTAGDLASGWTQVDKLTAGTNGAADDRFGSRVSIDGDTMVIGAWADDDNIGSAYDNIGSAYVFTRDTAGDLGSDWTQVAKLTAGDRAGGDRFGTSVSIDGDTVVIGANMDDDDGSDSGSAYVFTRATPGDLAASWTQVAKLTADDGAAGDYFGTSVSIDGDTMVIGGGFGCNSAYVFTRDTAGDPASGWTQVGPKLTESDGAAGDYFGVTVSIGGDTIVIGAILDDDKGTDSGSAYVFTRDTAGDLGSGWTQVAKLTADDGAGGDQFGNSVSIDGDTIVIGVQYYDDPTRGTNGHNFGSAYVFTRDTPGDLTSGWTQVAKLTADDGAGQNYFGKSVSIDGHTVVIGAHYAGPIFSSGSAYVFSAQFSPCDASSPPANGTVGDCTSVLDNGSTCQPVCDPGYAVSGPSVCENSVLSPAVCIPLCDASTPPANGAVGNCTDQLLSGTTCQPVCDPGYFAPEPISVCDDGVLTPAVCVRYCNASAPPANGGVGDCVEYMLSDTTCQPTCDEGYIVSGKTSCDAAGALTAADCRELSCCEQTFTKFGFGVAYSYGDEL